MYQFAAGVPVDLEELRERFRRMRSSARAAEKRLMRQALTVSYVKCRVLIITLPNSIVAA